MYAVQAYCGSSNKNSLFSIGASSFGTNKQGQITAYGEASINIGKAMVSAIEIKQSFGFSIGGITVEVGGKGYAGAWGAEGKFNFSSSGISISGGLAAKVGAGVFINIRW